MWFNTLVLATLSFFFAFYYFVVRRLNYWKSRNVPCLKPLPFFGNYKDYILLQKKFLFVTDEICKQFPNEPYIGTLYGTEPTLIVKDPKLLKLITTQDFYFFSGREITDYNHKETVTNNMFFHGGDKWKVVRQNLTPLFTSMKMKKMFHLIKNIGDSFEKVLQVEVESASDTEIKTKLVKYTLECILSCGFGISAELLQSEGNDSIFINVGNSLFDNSKTRHFKNIIRSIWPKFFYALGLNLFDPKVAPVFNNLLSDVFQSRLNKTSNRNDFVDLILSWKNEKHIYGDSLDPRSDKKISFDVTDVLLISQCILFYAAGFETTSATLSFLMYELIHEVLRLYPVLGVLTREVMKSYTLPTGLKLEKGNRIHIPLYHIHRDPKFFPNPEEFRPERFFGEEKKKVVPYSFMPFGEGPRICIGQRFAKMVMHNIVLKIFKNCKLAESSLTPKKLDLTDVSIVTQTNDEIYVKLIKRL
ncbi:cytochrome P450 [Danaus plexippus plexippus]|uniref:unspecific monooxygenase n=1 Tax=Danaus plexippus plexippus TaxID=278856 RepID=A0A212FJ04_DANPL|nr:cytochrome P450 [Danaus plexippus plexippus]